MTYDLVARAKSASLTQLVEFTAQCRFRQSKSPAKLV